MVITGVGVATPVGSSLDALSAALREGRTGVVRMDDWDRIGDLRTRLGAPVTDIDLDRWPRKLTRTVGRLGRLAMHASDDAIASSGLDEEVLRSGEVGVAFGSTHGSSLALESFVRPLFANDSLSGLAASAYLKFMSHTAAANLALAYGVRGRVLPTCAACVSGSLAVGEGYEAVRDGAQAVMLCGGAEELHWVPAGVFDLMGATSTRFNDAPGESPRPFDIERDGLVVGEGAGAVVLESFERARARGAAVLAEVIGYGASCDGAHITAPSAEGMADAMRRALADAGISAREVNYVNAHATGTELGDIAEVEATRAVFGDGVPVSSCKGNMGHTLGACGAIEVAACVAFMRDGFVPATRNLTRVDPRCEGVDHVMGAPREMRPRVVMSNNFAFGGLNTSLVLRAL